MSGALLCGVFVAVAAVQDPSDDAQARAAHARALDWIVGQQRDDGAFSAVVLEQVHEETYSVETFHAWGVAAHAIACSALRAAPADAFAAHPTWSAALERGLDWFATCRTPQRGNDWDNDAVWAWLFGYVLAVEIADDPRFATTARGARVVAQGRACLDRLVANQVPLGGFGYYDDPPYTRRPKWATSFCTALVLPALARGRERGWVDAAVVERATRYVRRCRLPNGAFAYDLDPIPGRFVGESIDNVKGALGRIQVCHWALHALGDPAIDFDALRRGLAMFFAHHEFLAVARMRPIPHEAYYANAGYFFLFGHLYAARVIELLPAAERPAQRAALRARLLETQRPNGTFCDYLGSNYSTVAGTGFAALALSAGFATATADGVTDR